MHPEAWNTLVDRYSRLIAFWAKNLGVPAQSIPDVLQTVLLKVAVHLPAYQKDGETAAFRRWLRAVTGSQVAEFQRQIFGRPAATGGSEALARLMTQPDTRNTTDGDSTHRLSNGLDELLELVRTDCSESTWQAFWMTTFENCTSSEAAKTLGMSANAVRLAKSRVLMQLRRLAADRPQADI